MSPGCPLFGRFESLHLQVPFSYGGTILTLAVSSPAPTAFCLSWSSGPLRSALSPLPQFYRDSLSVSEPLVLLFLVPSSLCLLSGTDPSELAASPSQPRPGQGLGPGKSAMDELQGQLAYIQQDLHALFPEEGREVAEEQGVG